MKLTRRIAAFVMAFIMIAAGVVLAASALVPEDTFLQNYKLQPVGEETKVNDDVSFQKYALTSGVNETTVDAVALMFDSKDGYIPMAFMGYAGTSATVEKHAQIAHDKYGYEVVGAVNGSFFSMDSGTGGARGAYGTLVDYIISNGKVMSAHAGDACEVVAFASDGTFQVVNSLIDYKLYINGQSPGSLYYVNKTSGTNEKDNGGKSVSSYWGSGFYYFDTSCGRVTDTNDWVEGYNVLCRKLDNTDLVVGGTLKGEVISVTKGTDGAQVSEGYNDVSDKFDIFVRSDSVNAKYVKDLQPGDSVDISVTETVEASREIIENANSVIENVGWLVKNGEDQTKTHSTIGTHSVELKARWTAFGRKADGSYVFFTTDSTVTAGSQYSTGNSPCATLRDVAKTMIDMGCVDVIRMDGGGSTAMYAANNGSGNPGYLMATAGYVRPVSDAILIVKKPSAVNSTVNEALKAALAEAKKIENPETAVKNAIDEIDALLAKEPEPVLSDARRLLMKLQAAQGGKDGLNAAIANAAGIKFTDYSFEVMEEIYKAYDEAVAVYGDKDASSDAVSAATDNLNFWLSKSGAQELSLCLGKSYTVEMKSGNNYTNFNSAMVDDLKRLTDGKADSLEGTSPAYSAWQGSPIITVDLGEKQDIDAFSVHMARMLDWGISSARSVTVSVSDDGKTFKEVGKEEATYTTVSGKSTVLLGEFVAGDEGVGWNAFKVTVKPDKAVSGRYVRFEFGLNGNFLWLTEVEAVRSVDVIEDGVYITGFNRTVLANDSCLFDHSMGNLRENNDNVNAKYTRNVFLKWSEADGCYIVTQTSMGDPKAGMGVAPNITLAEDELLLAVHGDAGTEGYPNREFARQTFVKGAKVALYGVDVENARLKIAPFARLAPAKAASEFQKGDINGDGRVNAQDYMLLKRIILKTTEASDDVRARCDITGDGKLQATDYMLLKRMVLRTA